MDWQALFNIAVGLIGAIAGWVIRVVWTAQESVRQDLAALERALPSTYVRRDDLRDWKDEILAELRRLGDKLDSKADK